MSPVSDRQRMNRQMDMEFRQRGLRPPVMDSRIRDPDLDRYLSSSVNDFQRSRGGPDRSMDYQRNPRPDYLDDLPMPSRGASQRSMEMEYRSSRPTMESISNRDSRIRKNPDLDQYMSSALSDFQRSRGGGPVDLPPRRQRQSEFRDDDDQHYRQERPIERQPPPIEYPSRYLSSATQRPSERPIEYPSRYLDPAQRSSAIERPTESVFSSSRYSESERVARVAPQPPRLTELPQPPKGILKSSQQYTDIPSSSSSGRPEPLFRAYGGTTPSSAATSSQNYSDRLRVERELRQTQYRAPAGPSVTESFPRPVPSASISSRYSASSTRPNLVGPNLLPEGYPKRPLSPTQNDYRRSSPPQNDYRRPYQNTNKRSAPEDEVEIIEDDDDYRRPYQNTNKRPAPEDEIEIIEDGDDEEEHPKRFKKSSSNPPVGKKQTFKRYDQFIILIFLKTASSGSIITPSSTKMTKIT